MVICRDIWNFFLNCKIWVGCLDIYIYIKRVRKGFLFNYIVEVCKNSLDFFL